MAAGNTALSGGVASSAIRSNPVVYPNAGATFVQAGLYVTAKLLCVCWLVGIARITLLGFVEVVKKPPAGG